MITLEDFLIVLSILWLTLLYISKGTCFYIIRISLSFSSNSFSLLCCPTSDVSIPYSALNQNCILHICIFGVCQQGFLINQACSGPYWENIKLQSFFPKNRPHAWVIIYVFYLHVADRFIFFLMTVGFREGRELYISPEQLTSAGGSTWDHSIQNPGH